MKKAKEILSMIIDIAAPRELNRGIRFLLLAGLIAILIFGVGPVIVGLAALMFGL